MPLSREDQALHSELSEARFAIQRQLEVLRYPSAQRTIDREPRDRREIVARLQRQLKDIEEALADLDASGTG
jgi:hypothetical protein